MKPAYPHPAVWAVRIAGLVLLVTLLARDAAALQEVRASLFDDARFDQKISFHFKKTPLSAVVAELARQTGVPMRAARDVADEPVIAFVNAEPARDVAQHLAALLGYRWGKVRAATGPVYEIYQDVKSRREEEALRDASRLRAVQALQAAIRQRIELARRPPDELLKAADAFDEDRPARLQLTPEQRRARLARPGWGLMMRAGFSSPVREMAGTHCAALAKLAASLTEEHWRTLAAAEVLWLSTRPEPGTQPLPAAHEKDLRSAPAYLLPPGSARNFAQPDGAAIHEKLRQQTADQWTRAEGYRVRIRLELPPGRGDAEAVLTLSPQTLMPADFGGEQKMSAGALKISSKDVPGASEAEDPEPSSEPPTDPVLLAKQPWTTWIPRGKREDSVEWINQVLPLVAETYRINLLADAYRHPPFPLPRFAQAQQVPLYGVLDAYLRPISAWRKSGSFVEVRRSTWYYDRLAEIPERFVRKWSGVVRRHPNLRLEQVSSLVSELGDAQLDNLEPVMRDAGTDLGDRFCFELRQQREILRLCGLLTPVQQERLKKGGAISYQEMSPAARQQMHTAYARHTHDDPDPPPPVEFPPALLTLPPALPGNPPQPDRLVFQYVTGSAQRYFHVRIPAIEWKPGGPEPTPGQQP